MRKFNLGCFLVLVVPIMGQQSPLLIGLGEEAHGYASLNDRKAHLLDSLARHCGVDAVILESSFVGSVGARKVPGEIRERMTAFAYPYWITDTIVSALDSAVQDRNECEFLWGCDIQEDCRFHENTLALLKHEQLGAWRAEMLWCDSVLELYIGPKPQGTPMTGAESHVLAGRYAWIRNDLMNGRRATRDDTLIARCLENRISLCHYLTLKKHGDRIAFRDSLMYANIRWIMERVQPKKPSVFWAADLHVVPMAGHGEKPAFTGDYLRHWLGEEYQSVSITHRRRRTKGADVTIQVRERLPIPDQAWETPCP